MLVELFCFTVTLLLVYIIFTYYSLIRGNSEFWSGSTISSINPRYVDNLIKRIVCPAAVHETNANIYNDLKNKNLPYGAYIEMGTPKLVIRDTNVIKHICIKDFDYFINRRKYVSSGEDKYHNHILFNLQDQEWKTLRKAITPTFSAGKMKKLFPNFLTSAEKLVNYITNRLRSSTEIELEMPLNLYTLDAISSAAFGIQSNVFEDPKNSNFAKMGLKFKSQFGSGIMIKFFVMLLFPKITQFLGFGFHDPESSKFLADVIKAELRSREKHGDKKGDFIQIMREASNLTEEREGVENIGIDENIIIAQCIQFIQGGFDTTGSLLAFVLHSLALHPEILQKLTNEVDRAFTNGNEKLSYEDFAEMHYLDTVISETLRLYPPTTAIVRKTGRDYKIPGSEDLIPKGTIISIPVFSIHRDEKYWPIPEKFDPERFSPENKQNIVPYSWQPFGIGPRNCIGMRFGLLETKVAVAYLLRHFTFRPSRKTQIPMKFKVSAALGPNSGVWLSVEKREL